MECNCPCFHIALAQTVVDVRLKSYGDLEWTCKVHSCGRTWNGWDCDLHPPPKK